MKLIRHNELFPIVIERHFKAEAIQIETISFSSKADPVREIFIDFLKQSIKSFDEVLKRVDQKYPELTV